MAAVVAPGPADFKPALQLRRTATLLTKQELGGKPSTKTLSESASAPDDRLAFSKTWTGSTRAPNEFDQGELFIDDDSDDDRSPWASDANIFGDLSFSSETKDEDRVQFDRIVAGDLLPSEGSKLHAAGECKPCAWFWKASGCLNGRECMHCHLCPKARKKARKKEKLRENKAAAAFGDRGVLPSTRQPQLPEHVDLTPRLVQQMAVPFRPPPGLPHPPPSVPMLIPPPGFGCPLDEPDVKEQISLQNIDESTTDGLNQQADQSGISDRGEVDASSVSSNDDLCSVGSQLHAAGECRPCSWFWKPQGCKNGKNCLHCHLCLEGEVKRKKKQRATESRKLSSIQFVEAESRGIRNGVDEATNSLQLQALMVQKQLLIQQQQHQLLQMRLQMGVQQQQMQLARLPVL